MSGNNSGSGCAVAEEVRIASVASGGVSLVICGNGITQKLLRAVRAALSEA